ncbi:MAG: hypothetical protein CM1200mP13_05750 [Candidatus Pelagibacterales bacterium]|nr:MAG: hypothetical protein CM1200mP13_05750 [Pelagibacterales bacterium]
MQLAENIFCLAHGKMLANGSQMKLKMINVSLMRI